MTAILLLDEATSARWTPNQGHRARALDHFLARTHDHLAVRHNGNNQTPWSLIDKTRC
jgi:hypothetical protein